jgi:Zn-dependent M28 family amino/carboxypeptidase
MFRRILLALVLLFLVVLILANVRALYEGVFFYLRDVVTYDPRAVTPVSQAGRYASVYDLVRLRNAERRAYILQRASPLAVFEIPIPNSRLTNIFVRSDSPGPYTIFSAHYDKLYDNADYQGASDNTAAVSVLLAAIDELARRGDTDNHAFLFTGEEETGLRGAQAFVEYARANNLPIRAIVNFDNIGRGRLAIRPSAERYGFMFTLPLFGDFAYDGRVLNASPAYPLANARLTQELMREQPGIIVYEHFTALSDSNVFQATGIDTVSISSDNMYYLEMTLHTNGDRVELLDEDNLDLAFDLILKMR